MIDWKVNEKNLLKLVTLNEFIMFKLKGIQ